MFKPALTAILTLASGAATAQSHVDQQKAFLDRLTAKGVTDLDQVPSTFTPKFLSNFIIKHGMNENGARGHKHEPDVPGFGIHAVPQKPRIYVFDPSSGFVVSYNSDRSQQGGESLDLMTFDKNAKSFEFNKIDFPAKAGEYKLSQQSCTACHGGVGKNEQLRPIFSMYPDWPRFFGSDNDELKLGEKYPTEATVPRGTDQVTRERIRLQRREWAEFHKFRTEIAPNHPRYAPLFSDAAYKQHGFNMSLAAYPEYPYRSDVEDIGEGLNLSDLSRAFARRAGLRFNLLYSRLLVKQVVNKIVSQKKQFEKFGSFFVYNIMRCGPETNSAAVINKWSDTIRAELQRVEQAGLIEYRAWDPAGAQSGAPVREEGNFRLNGGLELIGEKRALLQYGQNLALFGLKLNDVDMRFTYYHPDYLPQNAYRKLAPLDVMQVGYLGDSYFNSYNDGSTTMDEHLAAELLQELAKTNPALKAYLQQRGAIAIRGLLDKYSGPTYRERMKLDREFFTQLDALSKWFSLPYPYRTGDEKRPTSFIELHHRAPFAAHYRETYNNVCKILSTGLLK